MRRHIAVPAVATAVALAGLVPADAMASGTGAAPGAQLWVARYDGPASSFDYADSMAMSPGGSRIFVTGVSYGGRTTGHDYATVAYSAATGRRLWVSRCNGPANGDDSSCCVAVNRTGTTVFVTGSSYGVTTRSDYATVAYRG